MPTVRASRSRPAGGRAAAVALAAVALAAAAGCGSSGDRPAGASGPPVAPAPVAAPVPAAGAPVLGADFFPGHLRGFGTARPVVIDLGGDPTGLVTGISWSSWGGATAVGRGIAEHVGPDQTVAEGTQLAATVVAFDRGLCAGQDAYLSVSWFFPSRQQVFDPRAGHIDACTGAVD